MFKSHLMAPAAFAFALAFQPLMAAAVTTDEIVANYQAQGYDFIEITRGLTQTKVEGVKGTTKTEIVIDTATGAIVKSETEAANPEDIGRTGIHTRTRARDFVRDETDDSDDMTDDDGVHHDDGDDGHGDDHDGDDGDHDSDHDGDHDGDHGGDDHGDHSGSDHD